MNVGYLFLLVSLLFEVFLRMRHVLLSTEVHLTGQMAHSSLVVGLVKCFLVYFVVYFLLLAWTNVEFLLESPHSAGWTVDLFGPVALKRSHLVSHPFFS